MHGSLDLTGLVWWKDVSGKDACIARKRIGKKQELNNLGHHKSSLPKDAPEIFLSILRVFANCKYCICNIL